MTQYSLCHLCWVIDMKKSYIIGIVVAIIVVIGISLGSGYNKMVKENEDVESAAAQIDVQLKRRTDLIPNLVNTVKGYMTHEQKVIDSITTARENLVNASTVEDKASASEQLTKALNNLYVIVENYPDLKSNTNFINLQDELAGTENRIAVARKDYNDAVKEYNNLVKTFPNNLTASLFNFKEKSYFEVNNSDKEVPNVSFE